MEIENKEVPTLLGIVARFIEETGKQDYEELCKAITFEKTFHTLLSTPVLQVPRIELIKVDKDTWQIHGNFTFPSEFNPKYSVKGGRKQFAKDIGIIDEGYRQFAEKEAEKEAEG